MAYLALQDIASSSSPPAGMDWQQILPAGLDAPSEVMPVSSRCSSSYSTWEQANPIMYNVRLAATKGVSTSGEQDQPLSLETIAPATYAQTVISRHFGRLYF